MLHSGRRKTHTEVPAIRSLAHLLPALRRHALPLVVGFTFMLLQNWAFSRIPGQLQVLLDEIVGANRRPVVLQAALWATLFAVGTALSMFAMRKLIISASRHIEHELRDTLFRRLLDIEYDFYLRRRTGDTISRCTNDLNDVRTLLGPGVMYVPDALSRLALFLPILFGLSGTMTNALLLTMGVLVAVTVLVIPRFRPLYRAVQEQVGAINDRVWQLTTGITTVKLYAAGEHQRRRFAGLNAAYIRANMRVLALRGGLWPLLHFVFGLMQLVTLWVGGRAVMSGELSIGELLQFATMVAFLSAPIMQLGWVMTLVQQGISAMQRVEAILLAPREARTGDRLPSRLSFALRQVSYRHPGADADALAGVTLDIDPGERVGITGPVGSGKSTLLGLLSGMLHPTGGDISIGGRPLAAYDLAELRRRIGFVPQETFLFSMTVAQNIAMGAERPVSAAEIAQAAERAALAGDIAGFADRYQQLVGERGITLSGGQKQRLALARALVAKHDVLVLDDALSSVDSATENGILDGLAALSRQRSAGNDGASGPTILMVSHRVSALRTADRIVVLERGRVVEQGSHAELLAAGGTYARLAELQQLESSLA